MIKIKVYKSHMKVSITNDFATYHKNPGLLLEGGLYGHMCHIYEDLDLPFEALNQMVVGLLKGEIDGEIKEKIDGQALAVSIDEDNVDNIIFARNVGNVKNFGENALKSWKHVHSKFGDVSPAERAARRDLIKAFTFAAKDLTAAINQLPAVVRRDRFFSQDKRVPKIDKRGEPIKDKRGEFVYETVRVKNWLHFEIVWPETTNVIPYNHRMIVLHNYVAYDQFGKKRVTSDFNQFATDVQEQLRNVGAQNQRYFDVASLPNVNKRWDRLVTPGRSVTIEDFEESREEFLSEIKKIQQEFSLTDRNTLGDYYTGRLVNMIYTAAEEIGYQVSSDVVNMLVDRWLHGVKKPDIKQIRDKIVSTKNITTNDTAPGAGPDVMFKEWVDSQNTGAANRHMMRRVKQPVIDLIIDLGITVINNMSDYLALGTQEQSSVEIKRSIESVVKRVRESRNPDHIDQIQGYLDIIQRAGGLDKIVPTEGILFTYKKPGTKTHSVYKLTGSFPALNELNGFFRFKKAR